MGFVKNAISLTRKLETRDLECFAWGGMASEWFGTFSQVLFPLMNAPKGLEHTGIKWGEGQEDEGHAGWGYPSQGLEGQSWNKHGDSCPSHP